MMLGVSTVSLFFFFVRMSTLEDSQFCQKMVIKGFGASVSEVFRALEQIHVLQQQSLV